MTSSGSITTIVLSQSEWVDRRDAHRARIDPLIAPRLNRRSNGAKHPVDDFLFDYYANSPGQLRTWHPGIGVVLEGADEYARKPHYLRTPDGVTLDPELLVKKQPLIAHATSIMQATQHRPPMTGCFALHEWAMVLGLSNEEVRHNSWPLRLTPAQVADTIKDQGLRCTHFDAFRFYTAEAIPLNAHQLSRANQLEFEQPGCLHATMDLYRWAFTISPLIESELVADAFELARRTRALDMQASPYDLIDLGLEPIRVETADGRAEYQRRQLEVIDQGRAMRERLLHRLEALCKT